MFVRCPVTLSEWEAEFESSGGAIGPIELWLKNRVHSADLDMSDPNESDTVLLSNPPSLRCKRYARMKAYGNHWRVDDDYSRSLHTVDYGVACFEVNEQSMGSGKDYLGLLEDILLLDYGKLNTPITLFSCQWKNRYDARRRNTYIRDDDGFLVVNFRNNVSKAVDCYVFPSQCTQVFFSDDDTRPVESNWKVVLRKEARSRRKMEEDDDLFILTNVETARMMPSYSLREHPQEPDLTGAILVNDINNAIALQGFEKERRRPPCRRPRIQTDVQAKKKRKRKSGPLN